MNATTTKGETTMKQSQTIETTYRKAHSLAVMLECWKAGNAPKKLDLVRSARELLAENELSEIIPGKNLSTLLDVAEYIHNEDRDSLRDWFFVSNEKLDVAIATEYSSHVLCG